MDAMTADPPTLATGESLGADPEHSGTAPWVVVAEPGRAPDDDERSTSRLMLTVALGAAVVLVAVSLLGVAAARTLAERQAVNDAAKTADLLAEAVVQPALRNDITDGTPAGRAPVATALAQYVASHANLVRVKVWARDGRILYSDESRLIGKRFALDPEELDVFRDPRTVAEVSDLDKPENVFERGQGKLLEAYRPVWTPNGTPLLFETYTPYGEVNRRAGQLWRGFAGVTVSSLLLFVALMVPLLWRLVTRLRAAQRQREKLLTRAVDASAEERARIAGTLHDGVVQELAATSFALGGAATRADALGDEELSADLRAASGTLRDSIGGMRTLLVDIYPETLGSAGILEVLRDLASTMRSREIDVQLDLPEVDPGLDAAGDRLVFRVVHECLQNVRRHSSATRVRLSVRVQDEVVVEVADDGVGFDPAATLAHPEVGHFGLRLLADTASREGARLEVASAPGAGCRWRLTVPRR
jgi:two-component system NarL family sensor kinase